MATVTFPQMKSTFPDVAKSLVGPALRGVGAGLSQEPSNTQTSSSGSSSGMQYQSGSGTINRNLTPYQDQLQSPLFKMVTDMMTNPQKTLAPFRNQARENVNQNYSGVSDILRKKFLSVGGGESGKFGDALIKSEVGRVSDLSKVDNDYSQQAAQMPMTAAGLAQALLGMDFGQTSNYGSSSNYSNQEQKQQKTEQIDGSPVNAGLGTFLNILGAFGKFI